MTTGPTESAGGPGEALEQFNRLAVSSSVEMWSAWARTWQSLLGERAAPAANSALRLLTDPRAWAGEEPEQIQAELERAFSQPRLADVPGPHPAVLQSWQPALELTQAAAAYARASAGAWAEMWQRFQADLIRKGRAISGPGEILDVWNEVVDKVLLEHNRSQEFAEIQRKFVRAAMRCRIAQQRLTDEAAEACGLPTRAEIDAIHLRMHNLSRRIRALDKTVAKLAAAELPEGLSRDSVLASETMADDASIHPQHSGAD